MLAEAFIIDVYKTGGKKIDSVPAGQAYPSAALIEATIIDTEGDYAQVQKIHVIKK